CSCWPPSPAAPPGHGSPGCCTTRRGRTRPPGGSRSAARRSPARRSGSPRPARSAWWLAACGDACPPPPDAATEFLFRLFPLAPCTLCVGPGIHVAHDRWREESTMQSRLAARYTSVIDVLDRVLDKGIVVD